MDIIESTFRRKSVNIKKPKEYGFKKEADMYSYRATLPDSGFTAAVNITKQGDVSAVVTDPSLGEPYTLHLSDASVGSFVGSVRADYEQALTDISDKCFDPDVFKHEQSKAVIDYVRNTYDDELEFLWKKFDDNAIVRRKDSKKVVRRAAHRFAAKARY